MVTIGKSISRNSIQSSVFERAEIIQQYKNKKMNSKRTSLLSILAGCTRYFLKKPSNNVRMRLSPNSRRSIKLSGKSSLISTKSLLLTKLRYT